MFEIGNLKLTNGNLKSKSISQIVPASPSDFYRICSPESLKKSARSSRLTMRRTSAPLRCGGAASGRRSRAGDSIAVNGVCLTVRRSNAGISLRIYPGNTAAHKPEQPRHRAPSSISSGRCGPTAGSADTSFRGMWMASGKIRSFDREGDNWNLAGGVSRKGTALYR